MRRLAALLCLLPLILLCACSAQTAEAPSPGPGDAAAATPSPAEPSAAPTPTPEPEAAPSLPPEPTPDLSPLPDDWFDDAVFFGDSVTVTLEKYCLASGDLGEAQFLGEYSYCLRDALTGDRSIWFEGKPYLPKDVLPLTGARKVFVLLGNNDLAYHGGVDDLMERWELFVAGLREQSPDAVIFIESALPVFHISEREGWNNALFDAYNARLRAFCEERGCVFVELAPYFKDENNCLTPAYCSDSFCHLTQEAIGIWVEQLKNPANYSVDPRSFDHD